MRAQTVFEERVMFFGAAIWPFQRSPLRGDGIKHIARLGFNGIELIG